MRRQAKLVHEGQFVAQMEVDLKDYHANVFYSDEDEGYIVDILDLRHCSAFGETPQEALAEALKAKEAWIKAAKAARKPVPSPLFRPAIYFA